MSDNSYNKTIVLLSIRANLKIEKITQYNIIS
jgi:hypothetical protein